MEQENMTSKEIVSAAEMHSLLEDALRELDHARVFIRTREKMHPDGVFQFDEVWSKVRRFLEQHA